jgi:Zn finger protein HypA/HybF involved in hydrogenase expression
MNEAKNLGDAVVDRDTEQGVSYDTQRSDGVREEAWFNCAKCGKEVRESEWISLCNECGEEEEEAGR